MTDFFVLKVPGLDSLRLTDEGKKKIENMREECKENLPSGTKVVMLDKEIDCELFRGGKS